MAENKLMVKKQTRTLARITLGGVSGITLATLISGFNSNAMIPKLYLMGFPIPVFLGMAGAMLVASPLLVKLTELATANVIKEVNEDELRNLIERLNGDV